MVYQDFIMSAKKTDKKTEFIEYLNKDQIMIGRVNFLFAEHMERAHSFFITSLIREMKATCAFLNEHHKKLKTIRDELYGHKNTYGGVLAIVMEELQQFIEQKTVDIQEFENKESLLPQTVYFDIVKGDIVLKDTFGK